MTSFRIPRAGRGNTTIDPTQGGDPPKIATCFTALQAEWLKSQAKHRRCSIAAMVRLCVSKEMDRGENS